MADSYAHPKAVRLYNQDVYEYDSDMAIPFALAKSRLSQISSESARRVGFPQQDRSPHTTPFTLFAKRKV